MLIVQILKTRALKREEGIDKFKILDANIKDQASQKGAMELIKSNYL